MSCEKYQNLTNKKKSKNKKKNMEKCKKSNVKISQKMKF